MNSRIGANKDVLYQIDKHMVNIISTLRVVHLDLNVDGFAIVTDVA